MDEQGMYQVSGTCWVIRPIDRSCLVQLTNIGAEVTRFSFQRLKNNLSLHTKFTHYATCLFTLMVT